MTNTPFDSSADAFRFDAAQGSSIQVPSPVSGDFSITFFVKFTEPCSRSSKWRHGCGLVTAQTPVTGYQHVGCFSERAPPNSDLVPLVPLSETPSIDVCYERCVATGADYFGMTYRTCRCVDSFGHAQLFSNHLPQVIALRVLPFGGQEAWSAR